jgi:hypothetical protein
MRRELKVYSALIQSKPGVACFEGHASLASQGLTSLAGPCEACEARAFC